MILRIKEELFIFLLAVQFMTRLPIPSVPIYTEKRQAAGPRYYPAVGIIVGGIAAAVYWTGLQFFESVVAVLLSMVVSLLITGAFHEDGLADTFDGLGGGRDRQRVLEIMKDSRIGVFGLTALTMTLALKMATLASMAPSGQ
jgi:adenosylcobinamide-GDP ribazoletransferase